MGLLLAATLASCGQGGSTATGSAPATTNVEPEATASTDSRIPCALHGATDFTPICAIEHDGDIITVRNPDGGFHRLAISDDGHGHLVAADGAVPADVRALDRQGHTSLEVSIGGDRYRLPAQIDGRLSDTL